MHFLGWAGLAIYAVLFAVSMIFAVRIERYKKKYDIQTYREILAFTEGRTMDEIEKARESGKRPYQKAIAFFGSAAAVVVIALLMTLVAKLFA